MAELEREYTIPLRKEFLKVPRYKRTIKSIKTIRAFIQKHMKVKDVRIGENLNKNLFERGWKYPPAKVKVKTKRIEEKDKVFARVELIGFEFEKEKAAKGWKEKIREKFAKRKSKEELEKKVEKEDKKIEKKTEEAKKEKEEDKLKKEVLEHTKLEKKAPHPAKERFEGKEEQARGIRDQFVTASGKK